MKREQILATGNDDVCFSEGERDAAEGERVTSLCSDVDMVVRVQSEGCEDEELGCAVRQPLMHRDEGKPRRITCLRLNAKNWKVREYIIPS